MKKVAGGKGPNVARVARGPVAGPVTGGAGGPGAFVDPGVRYTDVPAEADPITNPLEAGNSKCSFGTKQIIFLENTAHHFIKKYFD